MLTTKPDIQVRNVSHIISDTKIYLRKRVEKFRAGSLKYYLSNWENLTSDKEILSYVSGVKIIVVFYYLFLPDIYLSYSLSSRSVTNMTANNVYQTICVISTKREKEYKITIRILL